MNVPNPFPDLPPEIADALRQGYQQALETLCETMKNPDRDRDVVREQLGDLKSSGRPMETHIPTLMKLERITRETGGAGYMGVERTVFKELAQVIHPDLIPFLLDAFQYSRRYDNFAGKRRTRALELTVKIATRAGSAEAVESLIEMLSAPRSKVREEALLTLYQTYKWEGVQLAPPLVDHCWDMVEEDANEEVRQTALSILEVIREITYDDQDQQ